MEDHAGNDLAMTAALENMDRKADEMIEARDKLAAVLGLEADAHMLVVLKAAYAAIETMTVLVAATQEAA
jgi:hypothetical protein